VLTKYYVLEHVSALESALSPILYAFAGTGTRRARRHFRWNLPEVTEHGRLVGQAEDLEPYISSLALLTSLDMRAS
jgi:hypothetical protein